MHISVARGEDSIYLTLKLILTLIDKEMSHCNHLLHTRVSTLITQLLSGKAIEDMWQPFQTELLNSDFFWMHVSTFLRARLQWTPPRHSTWPQSGSAAGAIVESRFSLVKASTRNITMEIDDLKVMQAPSLDLFLHFCSFWYVCCCFSNVEAMRKFTAMAKLIKGNYVTSHRPSF